MAETADRDTAHRRADSPLLLVLFCSLIRYAYIIGALCVGYSCSAVAVCASRSCFSKIAVITYLFTLTPALFAHSCRDSLLISPPFFHCTVNLSSELARYFLLAANCASLVLFTCSPPLYRSTQHLYMSRHIFYTHLLRQIVIFHFFSFCMFCAWIYVTAYSIL